MVLEEEARNSTTLPFLTCSAEHLQFPDVGDERFTNDTHCMVYLSTCSQGTQCFRFCLKGSSNPLFVIVHLHRRT